jgi:hypothetical protein
MEVIFPADSHLRSLDGFRRCTSLYRLEVPASVETLVSCYGRLFWGVDRFGRQEIIYRSGTRMRPFPRRNDYRAFITFEDDNDLKNRRRRVHPGTSGI